MGTDRVELPEPEAGGLQPLGIAAFPMHPHREALGRIRTSNHQVRSLALWSIELRGRDVVHVRVEDAGIEPACRPGCKPSDHSQQSHPPKLSEYRQRESNPHGESPLVSETSASTHSAMPVCVGAARGWRESNSRPTARQADALPLSHTPKGVEGGVRGARILVSRASTGRLDRLSYHPTVLVLPINYPADPERRRTESNRPRAGLQPAT